MVAKGSPDIVGFTDEVSVDDAVAVSGYQASVARDARKARHVVDGGAVWRLHHELVGWNLVTTGAACTT